MYTNFTEYWNDKGAILERLVVTKGVAKMIWDDCAISFAQLMKEGLEKN